MTYLLIFVAGVYLLKNLWDWIQNDLRSFPYVLFFPCPTNWSSGCSYCSHIYLIFPNYLNFWGMKGCIFQNVYKIFLHTNLSYNVMFVFILLRCGAVFFEEVPTTWRGQVLDVDWQSKIRCQPSATARYVREDALSYSQPLSLLCWSLRNSLWIKNEPCSLLCPAESISIIKWFCMPLRFRRQKNKNRNNNRTGTSAFWNMCQPLGFPHAPIYWARWSDGYLLTCTNIYLCSKMFL